MPRLRLKSTYATAKLLASRTIPRYFSTVHGAGKRRSGMGTFIHSAGPGYGRGNSVGTQLAPRGREASPNPSAYDAAGVALHQMPAGRYRYARKRRSEASRAAYFLACFQGCAINTPTWSGAIRGSPAGDSAGRCRLPNSTKSRY